MEIITKKLKDFNINIVKTKKFRTVKISLLFARRINEKEKINRELLEKIFQESSEKYQTREQITIEKENNYSQRVNCEHNFWGFNSTVEYETIFLHEKYLGKGHHQKCLDFFLELVLNPNIKNNKFEKKSFTRAVKDMKLEIESLNENAARYSTHNARKLSGRPQIYSGVTSDKVAKITPSDLAQSFYDMIANDFLEITIVGDVDDTIIDYFKNKFKRNYQHKLAPFNRASKINFKEVKQASPFLQSELIIISKIKDITPKERDITASLYNLILGGNSNSKLFRFVREKKSLCYYIRSTYYRPDQEIEIRTSISKNNFQIVKDLIIKQMANIRLGMFSKKHLEDLKKLCLQNIYLSDDSQNGIINQVKTQKYVDFFSIDETKEHYKAITKQDIVSLAKRIEIDTIFFLEGTNEKIDN